MSQPVSPFDPVFLPLTVGQILERIFKLFRSNFLLFLRIAVVVAACFFLIYGLLAAAMFGSGLFNGAGHPPDPAQVMAVLIPAGLIAALAFTCVYAIFEAAGTHGALQANQGIKVSFRAAYGDAFERAGRFLWLMILRNLCIGLPMLVCYGIIAGLALLLFAKGVNPPPVVYFLTFPLIFLLYAGSMAYAIIMGLRLSLALPACVAEGVPALASLKRSFSLTRNAKGRIFVVLLVVYAAGYAVFMVFEMVCFAVIGIVVFLSAGLHVQHPGPFAAVGIGALMVGMFAAMFLWIAALASGYCIAFAVLYHDQRLRLDGVPPVAPAEEPA